MTLPDPQRDREATKSGSGGGNADSGWDSRVLQTMQIGEHTVQPRTGRYFAVHTLHYDKDYSGLNVNDETRARVALPVLDDKNQIEFDTETYMGFSVFVPNNFEHETGTGTTGSWGSSIILILNSDSSATLVSMRITVPKGETKAHWFLDYYVNPYSVKESVETLKSVDLGPVNPDKGKWTDFVIGFRSNPFSEGKNPAKKGVAKANEKYYEGNKGILQLWKGEGIPDPDGNRKMVRKISIVNSPVGNVPGTA